MAQETDAKAGTIWLDDEAKSALNQWMKNIESREGFEPKPTQAVESACEKAIAWEERGSDVL